MGIRKARGWCDICRDEKPDVTCVERDCRKSFHVDCLRNTGQLYEDDDFSNYLCPSCRDNEENDAFCYKCKSEGSENSTLLMCDGCPRSAHLECLGLKDVPAAEIWMCPVCAPPTSAATAKETTKVSHVLAGGAGGRSKLGNVDICYVCQKGGKILCCDVCDQSFHPKCIDPEFLEGTLLDDNVWSCPICRGEDPLKNMGHKRLTRAERQAKSREWQQCVRRESRRCRANRDLFLYECREALRPFVSPDVIARLKKSAAAARLLEQRAAKKLKREVVASSSTESAAPSPADNSHDDHDVDDDEDQMIEGGGGRRGRRRIIIGSAGEEGAGPSTPADPPDPPPAPSESSDPPTAADGASKDASAATTAVPIETATTESSVIYQDERLLQEAETHAAEAKNCILREGVELKQYQRWGVNWLLEAFHHKAGAILADEMGLGKTIQTLAFLSALKGQGISGPHLVVVPLSTVGNWAREVRKFTPHLTVTKICGSRQEREHAMADGVAMDGIYDIFITTYETAVTEEWFFTDRFKWQCVVLDEAHRIKNESARIRHSLDRVDCNMRVLLTGTPLQNNIKELFTLLNFLFPDIIKDSSAIEALFAATVKKPPKRPSPMAAMPQQQLGADGQPPGDASLMLAAAFDESKVDAVTTLLSNLMLRRTKDLVVRLPSKLEHDVWLPLSPTAALWYRRLLETTTDADDTSSIRKLLGAVIKMRICCCHPRGLVSREDQLKNLLETIRDAGGGPWNMDQLQEQGQELRDISQGWTHVCMSTKLVFLDKLLRQLHAENTAHCDGCRKEFETQQANRVRKLVKEKRESLEALMNGVQHLPSSQPVPQATVDAMYKLERELSILAKPETEGGGLNGLVEHRDALAPPADDPALFLSSLLPADATPEQHAALRTGKLKGAASMEDEDDEGTAKFVVRPHKVLIFTQFQLVLDELSAYCQWRGWSYMRLDGSTNKMIRELDTREFNSPDSNHFVYLISTRAGGLGINLVTANHVVMYDEDWNPFVDLQAVDRAHRIGQVRDVHVWRLMLEWTVEERMAIRRQQKLKLDRLLIQANVDSMEAGDADVSASQYGEKLSSDEIRRLIQYGRTALMRVSVTGEIEHMSLESIARRKRRELKDLEEQYGLQTGATAVGPSMAATGGALAESVESVSPSSAATDTEMAPTDTNQVPPRRRTLDVQEAMRDVEEPRGEPIDEDEGMPSAAEEESEHASSQPESAVSVPGGPVTSDAEYLASLYRENRPRRERRRPKTLYNPTLQLERFKSEIKIVREKKCFRCGGGGPPAVPSGGSQKGDGAKKKGAPHASPAASEGEKGPPTPDVLVGCMRCPKVYHLDACLGLDKVPPRTWMCPWHECCLCFRRAASAGGLLIHCAECPTAFCFDCFPPEYRRYTPPPQFFEDLQKRGWSVTPQKLVTFLCSKCKALKEQERRRRLTKQQLDAEMKSRKSKEDSARLEARRRQQQTREERMLARDRKQKLMDEKKKFLQQKKTVDDMDKELQDRLRQGIERLYPKKYLQLLQERRKALLEEYQQQHQGAAAKSEPVEATEPPPPSKDESAEGAAPPAQSGGGANYTDAAMGSGTAEAAEEPISAPPSVGRSATETKKDTKAPKKRFVIPDRIKSPSDTVKLCENCQLPMHEAAQCPFPREVQKQKIEAAGATTTTGGTPAQATASEADKQDETGGGAGASTVTPYVVVDLSDHEGGSEMVPAKEAAGAAATEADREAGAVSAPEAGGAVKGEGAVKEEVSTRLKEEPERSTEKPTGGKVKAAGASAKPRYRILCALCLDPAAVAHSRKHCEKLTEEDRAEYTARRDKYRQLVELLEKEAEENPEPIPTPTRLSEMLASPDVSHANLSDKFLDIMRRQLSSSADAVVQRFMRQVSLSACIPTKAAAPAAAKPTELQQEKHAKPGGESKLPPATGKNAITSYLTCDAARKDGAADDKASEESLRSSSSVKPKRKPVSPSPPPQGHDQRDEVLDEDDPGGAVVVLPIEHLSEEEAALHPPPPLLEGRNKRPRARQDGTGGEDRKKRKQSSEEERHRSSKRAKKQDVPAPHGLPVAPSSTTAMRSSPGLFRAGKPLSDDPRGNASLPEYRALPPTSNTAMPADMQHSAQPYHSSHTTGAPSHYTVRPPFMGYPPRPNDERFLMTAMMLIPPTHHHHQQAVPFSTYSLGPPAGPSQQLLPPYSAGPPPHHPHYVQPPTQAQPPPPVGWVLTAAPTTSGGSRNAHQGHAKKRSH